MLYKLKFIQSTDLHVSSTVTDSEDQSESTYEPVPYDSPTVKIGHVMAGAVQAIVGALYLDKVSIVKQHIIYRIYLLFIFTLIGNKFCTKICSRSFIIKRFEHSTTI